MRKLIFGAFLGLLASVCHAACDPTLTPTPTSRVGMSIPQVNSCGWGNILNNNFNILDSSVCLQGGTNSFTGTNTFTNPVAFNTLSANSSVCTDGSHNLTTSGCSSGGGSGTIIASPQHQIGYYSLPGSTATIMGDFFLTTDGSGNVAATTLSATQLLATTNIIDDAIPNSPFLGTDNGGFIVGVANPTKNIVSSGSNDTAVTVTESGTNQTNGILINMAGSGGGANTKGINISNTSSNIGNNYGVWSNDLPAAGTAIAGFFNGNGPGTSLGIQTQAIGIGSNTGIQASASGGTANHAINVTGGDIAMNGIVGSPGQILSSNGAGVPPTWVANSGGSGGGVTVYPASATASFPFGLLASTINVNGSGNGNIQLTIGGSAYTVASSSLTPNVGDIAIYTSTNETLGDGGVAPTVSAPNFGVQYNTGGIFTASPNFTFNGSSLTLVSSMSITTTFGKANVTPGLLDVFSNIAGAGGGQVLLSIGSEQGNNQVVIKDQTPIALNEYGANIGSLKIGGTVPATSNHQISDVLAATQFINLWNNGEMDLQTTQTSGGGGNIVLKPQQIAEMTISSQGVVISTGVTITVSSFTIAGQAVCLANGTNCQVGGGSILSTSTLQSGATFYVSSGTVFTQLNVSSGTETILNMTPDIAFSPDINSLSLIRAVGQDNCQIWEDTTTSNGKEFSFCSNGGSFYAGIPQVTGGQAPFFEMDTTGGYPGGSTITYKVNAIYNQSGIFNGSGVNGITVSSGAIFNGNFTISSTVILGGSPGTASQVLQSNGPGTVPSWTTLAGGGNVVTTSTQVFSGGNTFQSSTTFNGSVNLSTSVVISSAGVVSPTGILSGALRITEGSSGQAPNVAISIHRPDTGAVTGAIRDILSGAFILDQEQNQPMQFVTNGTTHLTLQAAGGLNSTGYITAASSLTIASPVTNTYEASFSTGGPYNVDVTTTAHLNSQNVQGSTVTSCGANASLVGSDVAGTITTGSGSPTACTLTFSQPYVNTPVCLCGANGATACDPTTISNTAVTFTLGITETVIKYICIGSD